MKRPCSPTVRDMEREAVAHRELAALEAALAGMLRMRGDRRRALEHQKEAAFHHRRARHWDIQAARRRGKTCFPLAAPVVAVLTREQEDEQRFAWAFERKYA